MPDNEKPLDSCLGCGCLGIGLLVFFFILAVIFSEVLGEFGAMGSMMGELLGGITAFGGLGALVVLGLLFFAYAGENRSK